MNIGFNVAPSYEAAEFFTIDKLEMYKIITKSIERKKI